MMRVSGEMDITRSRNGTTMVRSDSNEEVVRIDDQSVNMIRSQNDTVMLRGSDDQSISMTLGLGAP
jgi:hypothetical protein